MTRAAKVAVGTVGLILVTVLALGGCASGHYWTKPGSTEQEFKSDYYQCMKEFRGGGSKYDRNVAYEEKCLEGQGYKMGDTTPSGNQGLWKPLP